MSGKGGRVEEGIREERKRLKFLRERADYLIDSSHMLTRELRAELSKIFVENKERTRNFHHDLRELNHKSRWNAKQGCDILVSEMQKR